MTAAKGPSPKLGKSQALNISQGTVNRLATLVPSLTTTLSPVTTYVPGASGGVGNELTAASSPVSNSYGVWVAPDLNGDGSEYYVQIEAFGPGGGGGGGNAAQGGGGAGAGEYACESQYPIKPGASYAWVVGLPGTAGYNSATAVNPGAAGTNGGITVFDIAGLGLAGGVVANGGQGGDQTVVGAGGMGGYGSTNTIAFPGGNGGTNNSANGSDEPLYLARTNGMFVGNTLSTSIISSWYIMNDNNPSSATRNNSGPAGSNGTWTNFNGGFASTSTNVTPSQVPAYSSPSGTYGPNPTSLGWASTFNVQSITKPSARFSASRLTFSGARLTVSGWVQAPSAATWGNSANGSVAVIATNSQNYTNNSLKGYALYAVQNGSPAAPSWSLVWAVGNGSSRQYTQYGSFTATPGAWYYIVGTFNSSVLDLYVNGSSVATSTASFTSVPGGTYATTMGLDPVAQTSWFFGLVSNFWWANDCATNSLVSQAYGSTPATGGAGGGASGGPSAAGGAGQAGSAGVGGQGGTPAVQPTSLTGITTPAEAGFAGGNAGGSAPPSSGTYGAGGGGSGNMGGSPAVTTLTVPFSVAAAYCGPDATSNPGTPYNVNQQNNPGSGVTSVLFAGGLASDAASGSKNSILLLPKGLAATLGSGAWTITQVLLTFTNANPANAVESILEVGYTQDTVLPQTYSGSSLISHIAGIPVPSGAGEITYDLTPSGIGSLLASSSNPATAFMLGAGSSPSFDAYNSPAGPQFYSSVYGPGAYDTSGNAQFPYLTITLQKTLTVQKGSNGAGGGILVTALSNTERPLAFIQPFSGTDEGGNQYAQGYTGTTTSWDPGSLTPGSYKPESWHQVATPGGTWSNSGHGINGFFYRMLPSGDLHLVWDVATGSSTPGVLCTLPVAYRPVTPINITSGWYGTGPVSYNDAFSPHLYLDTNGQVTAAGLFTSLSMFGQAVIPLPTPVWSNVVSATTGVFNVKDYGATGDGVADDTAAIQATINAITGSAPPATNSRLAKGSLYFPPGVYKITSDLIIRSVQNFVMQGDGAGISEIMLSGTGFTTAGIFIDGSVDGVFESFSLQGNGTEQVPDGIRLDFTTAAYRSTTGNAFRDIRIRALNFVTGFSLEGNGSRQLDGTLMDNIVITGGQAPGAWSATGNWLAGFALGNGTYANNYNHVATGCETADCYYGWKINVSSIDLSGSQPANNWADFYIQTNGQLSLKNIQSQNCGQFIIQPTNFSPQVNSVEDVLISTVYPVTGNPIATLYGGIWHFKNISATFIYNLGLSAYETGTFNIAGTAANRPVIANFDNVCVNGTLLQAFPSPSNARITIRNFSNYNPATGFWIAVIRGDISSLWSGSWTILDGAAYPAALTPSFANGVASQLSDTTRDYMVYMAVTASGTATSLAIGPTSTPANTIIPSSAATAGTMWSFRLPAGWYVKWSGTTTAVATQTAIGC